jgi:hypothetical protein
MWAIFKLNVLTAMVTGKFKNDPEEFAEFYANEYDQCIKRGGDMLYGVNVINGNVKGMADAIKAAFKKGTDSVGESYNVLSELYPACFDAYWMGAEMSPLPNPLLKPLGWMSTPPAPGTIMNIGPEPITLSLSAAVHKALVEALKKLEDELKSKTVTIPGIAPVPDITVNVYDTVQKIMKKEPIDTKIKNHPIIKQAVEISKKLKEAKKKKAAIGAQIKKALKFEFPKLPSRKKIIEETKEKLLEKAIEEIEKQIIPPIVDIILTPIYQYVQIVVNLLDSIPKPKPTLPQIKKFVKDTIDGIKPEIELPGIEIPNLPTKEELLAQIKIKTPTKEEIKAMAYDKIKGLIPNPPFINFVLPNLMWSTKTNIMIDPFIMLAQIHLTGVGGNMSVTSQYPYPAPPAPAVLNWSAYNVITGPPVPDFPSTVKIPEVDLGSIEIPTFPELPELPSLSAADLVASLSISLPDLPKPTLKPPNIKIDPPNVPKIPGVG